MPPRHHGQVQCSLCRQHQCRSPSHSRSGGSCSSPPTPWPLACAPSVRLTFGALHRTPPSLYRMLSSAALAASHSSRSPKRSEQDSVRANGRPAKQLLPKSPFLLPERPKRSPALRPAQQGPSAAQSPYESYWTAQMLSSQPLEGLC